MNTRFEGPPTTYGKYITVELRIHFYLLMLEEKTNFNLTCVFVSKFLEEGPCKISLFSIIIFWSHKQRSVSYK